jgi:inorganic pyrophosphatase
MFALRRIVVVGGGAARASVFTPLTSSSSLLLQTSNNFGSRVPLRSMSIKGSMEDRGHALEEKAAREHDRQALEALAKKLGKPIDGKAGAASAFGVEAVGAANSREWRLFVTRGGARVSAWHDVPLVAGSDDVGAVHNLVVEMPKGTDAKMETSLDEPHNPIKQDVKNEKLRVITYGKSKWNYGSLPQTWEDSNVALSGTSFKGDGDPLDVVEIGGSTLQCGAVVPVRVLGALALIDEGEIDWKIIAIATADPAAPRLKDIAHVDKEFPGKLEQVREWYKLYKTVDGKGVNQFAFDGKYSDRAATLKLIEECGKSWKKHKKPKQAAAAKK